MSFVNPFGRNPVRDRPDSPDPAGTVGRRLGRKPVKPRSMHRYSFIAAGVLSFLIALAHGPTDEFVYDAVSYWNGTRALITGGNAFEAGLLMMRGELSMVVYLPASAASLLLGISPFVAVLTQNALLIAAIGVFLIPRIARFLVEIKAGHVWVSAMLCSVLLSGFAPYPLLDLWALALVLLGIILMMSRESPWLLGLGGLTLAAAINLRPSYLVPVGLAGIVWLVFYWHKAHWPAIGAILGFVPQVIRNAVFTGYWKPWPLSTPGISSVQALYAPFTVRYDTIAYVPTPAPQQFFCSPVMAEAFGDGHAEGTGDVLAFFAGNLPDSGLFMAQKIAASLNWSLETPYSGLPSSTISPLAVLVVLVSAVGLLSLIWHVVTRQSGPSAVPPMLLAVWFGSVATLAVSTPEARLALPVLMVGVIGAVTVVSRLPERLRATRATNSWAGGTALMVVLLLWLGNTGLSRPAPVGDVTAAVCRHG